MPFVADYPLVTGIGTSVERVLRGLRQLVAQVLQQLGVPEHRREGGPELVVDRVDQPVPQLLLLAVGGPLGGDVPRQHDRPVDPTAVWLSKVWSCTCLSCESMRDHL